MSPAPAPVLHVHTLPWVSGSGINTFLSMKLIDRERYAPALACRPGGRLEALVREHGFPFHPLAHMRAELNPVEDALAVWELVSLYLRLKPAVVHTHNSKAGFLGRLAATFLPRIKVVHTVHGFAFHERERRWRRELFRALEQLAFPWADAHIAISPALAAWAEREGVGRAADYDVIWSGIEIERFAGADREMGRRALGLKPDTVAVGIVAKLWEGKGHAFLIESLRPILGEKLKLVFIGEGPIEPRLRALANEHVIFAGYHADPTHVTAALDIAALPSEFEGMGRVLLEAQAAGVPALANRVGGMVDIVTDGGMLLPAGDGGAWRDAVRALAADQARRRAMGQAGQRFVGERFSARAMAAAIGKVYDRLLARDKL